MRLSLLCFTSPSMPVHILHSYKSLMRGKVISTHKKRNKSWSCKSLGLWLCQLCNCILFMCLREKWRFYIVNHESGMGLCWFNGNKNWVLVWFFLSFINNWSLVSLYFGDITCRLYPPAFVCVKRASFSMHSLVLISSEWLRLSRVVYMKNLEKSCFLGLKWETV